MLYIIFLFSLAAIVWGANSLVEGSVTIARRFRISDFVIGAVIVGIGTSMPELTVSAYGAWQGNVDVAIGNVVGSNIFNVLAILGLTAACWPVAVTRENMRFELPVCVLVSVLVLLLAFNFFDGSTVCINRIDGAVLLVFFVAYIYLSFWRERRKGRAADDEMALEEQGKVGMAVLRIVCGLAALVAGSHFFVDSAVAIARAWGVDEAFISITLIACGTSVPELAASLAAAFKKNTQLALGNIVGSNIFNTTFILGVSSQIAPLAGGGITLVDYIVMIAAAAVLLPFGFLRRIPRWGGWLMLLSYVAYTVYLVHMQQI